MTSDVLYSILNRKMASRVGLGKIRALIRRTVSFERKFVPRHKFYVSLD